jgi:DNA-binding winged helix-turn-helix (wHTH) protein/TolB-like protein
MAAPAAFRFGPFVLNAETFRLESARGDATLSPRATDLLLMFVRQPARLFTKEEIFQRLWPDVAVTDNALTQLVSEIRRVLGDTPGSARYVQTLSRRGYRFVAPVAVVSAGEAVSASPPPAGSGPGLVRPPAAVSRARAACRQEARSIRVLDFANVSRDRPLAWLSAGIAEALTNRLRAASHLRVIDRSDAGPGRVDVTSDFVVVGAFQRLDDQLRITARVVDERTREAVAHAMVDGARQSAFALEDALARELAASLALALAANPPRRARSDSA